MKKPVRNRFTETYEQEVTPERIRKFERQLAKFKTAEEKLSFARSEKEEYLKGISPAVLEASGMTAFPNFEKGTPLFFDRIIQMEIDKLEAECGKKRQAQRPEHSHREIILAHQTECEVNKKLVRKGATEWKTERGEKARQAFYSLTPSSKQYKVPTQDEWRKVIELLKHCQAAQKIAINKAE